MALIEYLDGFVKLLLLAEYHDITFLLSTQVLEFASHKWKLQLGLSAVALFFFSLVKYAFYLYLSERFDRCSHIRFVSKPLKTLYLIRI